MFHLKCNNTWYKYCMVYGLCCDGAKWFYSIALSDIATDMIASSRTPSQGEKIQHGCLICLGNEQPSCFSCLIKLGQDLKTFWAAAQYPDQAIIPDPPKNGKYFLFLAVTLSDIRQLTSAYHISQNPDISISFLCRHLVT